MSKPKPIPNDSSYSELIENGPGEEFTDSVAFMVAGKTVAARVGDPKYGPPKDTAYRSALAWSAILGSEVKPHQVPLMLAAYHGIRFSKDPQDGKTLQDMAGQVRISEVLMLEGRK